MKNFIRLILFLIFIVNCFILYSFFNINKKISLDDKKIILDNTVNSYRSDLTKLFKNELDENVLVQTIDSNSSGVIYKMIDNNFYIITAYHSVENNNNINIKLKNNEIFPATLVGKDEVLDLAILKITTPYKLPLLKAGNSDLVLNTELVLSIGIIEGLDFTGNTMIGSIANNGAAILSNDHYINYFICDIPVFSGFSGAALYNQNKEVIGIVTNKFNNHNTLSFALPFNEVKFVVDQIIQGETIERNDFKIHGVSINSLSSVNKSIYNVPINILEGVYVLDLLEGSKLYQIGVRKGDIILQVNDKITINNQTLRILDYHTFDSLKVKVIRNNTEMVLSE